MTPFQASLIRRLRVQLKFSYRRIYELVSADMIPNHKKGEILCREARLHYPEDNSKLWSQACKED